MPVKKGTLGKYVKKRILVQRKKRRGGITKPFLQTYYVKPGEEPKNIYHILNSVFEEIKKNKPNVSREKVENSIIHNSNFAIESLVLLNEITKNRMNFHKRRDTMGFNRFDANKASGILRKIYKNYGDLKTFKQEVYKKNSHSLNILEDIQNLIYKYSGQIADVINKNTFYANHGRYMLNIDELNNVLNSMKNVLSIDEKDVLNFSKTPKNKKKKKKHNNEKDKGQVPNKIIPSNIPKSIKTIESVPPKRDNINPLTQQINFQLSKPIKKKDFIQIIDNNILKSGVKNVSLYSKEHYNLVSAFYDNILTKLKLYYINKLHGVSKKYDYEKIFNMINRIEKIRYNLRMKKYNKNVLKKLLLTTETHKNMFAELCSLRAKKKRRV